MAVLGLNYLLWFPSKKYNKNIWFFCAEKEVMSQQQTPEIKLLLYGFKRKEQFTTCQKFSIVHAAS